MSHNDLAGVVHVSASLIGKIETGQRIATEDVIRACDELLDARGALRALWLLADASRPARGRPPRGARSEIAGTRLESQRLLSPVERALVRVERSFGCGLERSTLIETRSGFGVRSDRGTWIRLAARGTDDYAARGWGGIEAVAALTGVAVPDWLGTVAWRDREMATMWRADEMAIVEERPVEAGMYLRTDPRLPESWWRSWSATLSAFAGSGHGPSSLGREPLTDGRVAAVIAGAWPGVAATRVTERTAAHGAMTWAKLTGPRCWILGWSHWTDAPRGLDAAMLWSCSLAVPDVAARIWSERREDLESPSGTTMALYALARILADPAAANGPTAAAARDAAAGLLPIAGQSTA
jgi:hypothetical protein